MSANIVMIVPSGIHKSQVGVMKGPVVLQYCHPVQTHHLTVMLTQTMSGEIKNCQAELCAG
jgi:hypothetical protein